MIRGRASIACVVAAAALLAQPAVAGAADITVTGSADSAADDGICTLREAITVANTDTESGGCTRTGSGGDTIRFAAGTFTGATTITLSSSLPSIQSDVAIAGGECTPAGRVAGPCVGVSGPASGSAFVVSGDDVSIAGVAVTGAQTGIDAAGVSGFSATNDWLGVKLDGTTAGANETGLFVGHGSDHAQIGDGTAAARNVFGFNSAEGLDVEGASDNTIQGNYFGVKPDGTTAAPNLLDVEITGIDGGPDATGNVVGGTLSAGEASSMACDGPCNVISAATNAGIHLGGDFAGEGETPAQQTTIRGNYIGFGADGVTEHPNTTGIKIAASDDTTVGGPSALDANHVVVDVSGITGFEGSDNQLIQNNLVGLNAAGTALQDTLEPEGAHGMRLQVGGGGDTTVLDNHISAPEPMDDPIETLGGPALVARNVIGIGTGGESLTGGDTSIDVIGGSPGAATTVTGNLVNSPARYGIEIQGANETVVTGNTVLSPGIGGIWVHYNGGTFPSSDVLIGGGTAAAENVISGSVGAAIEVEEDGNAAIDVARNRGSGNGGPFIDLGADGLGNQPGGPNDGIQAPAVGSVEKSAASGTALPGATVMAFAKASAANGEIAGFLGSAVADSSGGWQIQFGTPLAGGANVGFTQTDDTAGTSELAVGAAPPDPPGPPPPPDTDAPQTTIAKGPARRSKTRWAKFLFGSDEAGSTFLCRLDRGTFKPCRSPRLYRHLRPGAHVFRVKSIDSSGNVDPTAARRRFVVLD